MVADGVLQWFYDRLLGLVQALPSWPPAGLDLSVMSLMGGWLNVTCGYIDWPFGVGLIAVLLALYWAFLCWAFAYFLLKAAHILG